MADNNSMKGKWDYSGSTMMCFSDTEMSSYKKSAEFLGRDEPVEDWGCGTGWSKRYFRNYVGVDGSEHPSVDILVDLIEYESDIDNILMRQVLECNDKWEIILDNVIKSFRKKFCLIIYTPFVDKTRVGYYHKVRFADGTYSEDLTICEMYFNKQDILDKFPPEKFKVSEEEIKTNQGYGRDWVLYVERI
jgi:hypothetical protein